MAKKNFKLKITVSIESKTDEGYSSWREEFSKVGDEVLVLDSETATVESLQKVVKANIGEVLVKTQNYIENSSLISSKEENLSAF